MRGEDIQQNELFSYGSLEERIPASHPLRPIRTMVDEALKQMNQRFDLIYGGEGRRSIPPERLLRALLLRVLSVRLRKGRRSSDMYRDQARSKAGWPLSPACGNGTSSGVLGSLGRRKCFRIDWASPPQHVFVLFMFDVGQHSEIFCKLPAGLRRRQEVYAWVMHCECTLELWRRSERRSSSG